MGKVYTTTGIGINFGGSSIPTANQIVLTDTSGTNEAVISMNGSLFTVDNNSDSPSSVIQLDCLAGNIRISAGGGTVSLYALGTGSMFRFHTASGANGTIAELDNTGNLRIAGSIGTGITF
ncbi:MAG TPA: hypothetical protein VI461_11540 [Chitinophagaceae bacterium]|nr:hypothetical protein [Chitinophagaceae bacterium]